MDRVIDYDVCDWRDLSPKNLGLLLNDVPRLKYEFCNAKCKAVLAECIQSAGTEQSHCAGKIALDPKEVCDDHPAFSPNTGPVAPKSRPPTMSVPRPKSEIYPPPLSSLGIEVENRQERAVEAAVLGPPSEACKDTREFVRQQVRESTYTMKDTGVDGVFPIREKEWRLKRDPIPEAYTYQEIAMLDFSPENLEKVQLDGAKLVICAGGFRMAAREHQEINMRNCADIRANIPRQKHLSPVVADQLEEFFRLGAFPSFASMRVHLGKGRGFPHDDTKTTEILQSLWPDVQRGRILITGASAVPYLERVEATPTASVPKRGPDLLPSGKVRAISDMRRINLSLAKYDVYAVTVPQIQEIAEKIIAIHKLYHGIKVDTCKRDIDAAFKRVMLHPDVIVVDCREFKKEF